MANDDALPFAQQENLLALIAHSEEHGRFIAQAVPAEYFEGDYRTIAERCISFWRQQDTAPKLHTADLFSDILEDKGNRKANTFRRVLSQMQLLYDEGMNFKYVVGSVKQFLRVQRMKGALYRAAEIINSGGELTYEQAETTLREAIEARDFQFDPGLRLHEIDKMLEHFAQQDSEFETGIEVLDRAHIKPQRGKAMCLIAPSGLGKTWGCVHIGKRNLARRKRILHLTGEVDAEDIMMRYYQSLFAVPKRDVKEESGEELTTTFLRTNGEGEPVGFRSEPVDYDFFFSSPDIRLELTEHIKVYGEKFFDRLIIKKFPQDAWTIGDFRTYLDSLEQVEGFVPDLLIVDAPYHFRLKPDRIRHDLRSIFAGLRGLATQRNMALVCTHQVSKEGADALVSRNRHLAEAYGILWELDVLLTMSATDAEQQRGLARMLCDKSRGERGKLALLMIQNLDIGQFCISSTRFDNRYYKLRDKVFGKPGQVDDDDDEDYDD